MGKQIGKPYRIDNRNRIVIPKKIMELFHLKSGDFVVYELLEKNAIKLSFRYLDKNFDEKK